MTNKSNSSQHADKAQRVQDTSAKVATEKQPSNKAGIITGAVAILLVLGLTAGLYYHGHQQNQRQQQAMTALQQQFQQQQSSQQALQQQLQQDQQQLASQLQQSDDQVSKMQQSEQLTAEQLKAVQLAIASLKLRNPNEWMLAEAQYLVRMAGRKLVLEQDVSSSLALLSSADTRISELNDPSLLPLRKVIAEDIAALTALPQIDRDGLALQLATLTQSVDKLTLAGFTKPPVAVAEGPVSSDAADWKQNIMRSWNAFIAKFISVRRQNNQVDALLAPETAWYLAENVKTKLLQAELAVYRQDQAKFVLSLSTAIDWITHYYDIKQPATTAMLASLNDLKAQHISANLPTKLTSAGLLENTIKERKIQSLITPPATATPAQ